MRPVAFSPEAAQSALPGLRASRLLYTCSPAKRSASRGEAAIRGELNGDHPADPFGFHIAAVALLNNRAARHHQIAIR